MPKYTLTLNEDAEKKGLWKSEVLKTGGFSLRYRNNATESWGPRPSLVRIVIGTQRVYTDNFLANSLNVCISLCEE